MKDFPHPPEIPDYDELLVPIEYDFGLKRRSFMQLLGAGLLIATSASPALGQQAGGRRGGGGGGAKTLGARIHLATDGAITVLVGKVEGGQGARAEFTQAAAEELGVNPNRLHLIMADTAAVPDDGITAGSGSTPRTVPSVRQASAAVRQLLVAFACKQWEATPESCQVQDGKIVHSASKRSLTYADLAANAEAMKNFDQPLPSGVTVNPVKQWKVLGVPLSRPNGRDFVTGAHQYPSDIKRPGMLYGKVLRPPAYGATLTTMDVESVRAMKDVVLVRDEQFVGVAAPTSFRAEQALAALAGTARWDVPASASSSTLYEDLVKEARVPENPFKEQHASSTKGLKSQYKVAYVQHAPLEPRAAVAEWTDGQLTVWASTQNPFGHRGELARAFRLSDNNIRVVVPDFGAGFGGKHTGEASVEAARLAKGAGKPVSLRWSREEEFTWAYFRPAAVVQIEASLADDSKINSWHFVNINSGGSAIESPYATGKQRTAFVQSRPPLRHGSYRGLAATANTFARECCMDELALAAAADPLAFRLAHLENERLRAVLIAAADRFDWKTRVRGKSSGVGVGLACGTEKGSFVAACVEVAVEAGEIRVRHVSQAFECGAILNPDNLRKQVEGALIMGLGPALHEEMRFDHGTIQNASFKKYQVPRFADVPEMEITLLNRPDLPSVGAGETPIIAIAPAIGNAVFHATGKRLREMPLRLS